MDLNLSATYLDEWKYTIAGTAVLEGRSLTVKGTPFVNDDEKLVRGQTSPIFVFILELFEGEKRLYWTSYFYWNADKQRHEGNLQRENGRNFDFTLERPPPP